MKLTSLRTPRFPTLLATLALAASSAFAATTYPVDLTPPWKVGQKYQASITANQSSLTTITMGENKVQEQSQKRSARFEADAEALEVFPHGGLRKAAYTVRTLQASTDDAAETEVLPAGAKITAESTGVTEKTFTVNGRAATAEQKAILDMVVNIDSEKHSDQILFGPKKPVAVGESWPLDAGQLKATLGKEFKTIAKTEGTMRLDSVEGSGDARVSVVSGSVNFSGILPEMPPGLTAKPGKFHAVLDGRIPATRNDSKRVENLTVNAEFGGEADGPDGNKMNLTVKVEAKHASVLTFP